VFVISRFDLRQLLSGLGDHWITGGALAISTLAAGNIASGARTLGILGHGGGALEDLSQEGVCQSSDNNSDVVGIG
jgi:hypothetical protein